MERLGEDFLTHFSANCAVHIVSETPDEIVCVDERVRARAAGAPLTTGSRASCAGRPVRRSPTRPSHHPPVCAHPPCCSFDLVGVDAPVANALRRILLSEVPSVAIETVYINQNTSIIQDEVLSHRLGLIPLRVDPRQMDASLPGDEPTDLNTIVYKLCVRGLPEHARYSKEELAALDNTGDDVEGRYTKVYSRDMQWQPQGTQEERFAAPADPVQGDILIAKLAPGQVIELEAHAVKSIGKDHAKFSPVCTASYRLLPAVTLSGEQPFVGDEARQLVAACPLGVFDIEDVGASRRAAAAAGDPPRARVRCGRLGVVPLLAAAAQRAAGRQCTRCCGALGARACVPPSRARDRSLAPLTAPCLGCGPVSAPRHRTCSRASTRRRGAAARLQPVPRVHPAARVGGPRQPGARRGPLHL